MPELGSLGSVRGALSDERPYRECENSRFARKRARSERIFAIGQLLIAQNGPNFRENWLDQFGLRVFTQSGRFLRGVIGTEESIRKMAKTSLKTHS